MEKGELYEVTRRGKSVALITPVESERGDLSQAERRRAALMTYAAVLDTSAAMAFFLSNEEGVSVGAKLNELFSANGQIFVPSLFWYETGNVLVTAERRKQITMNELSYYDASYLELAERLQIPLLTLDKRLMLS